MKKMICHFASKVKDGAVKAYEFAKKNTLAMVASLSALVPATSMMSVYAINQVNEENLIGQVLKIIFTLFQYIGILLLAWSIGMLVLAFKNEDADSKSRAIMMMVVSVVLIGVKTLFQNINLGITIP